jgi:hypothetical protein
MKRTLSIDKLQVIFYTGFICTIHNRRVCEERIQDKERNCIE